LKKSEKKLVYMEFISYVYSVIRDKDT
jgi:hypothetical protein